MAQFIYKQQRTYVTLVKNQMSLCTFAQKCVICLNMKRSNYLKLSLCVHFFNWLNVLQVKSDFNHIHKASGRVRSDSLLKVYF